MTPFGSQPVATKVYGHGTDRAAAPADTIARILPLAQAFGITRLANLTGLDRIGIPVIMVCRPNARSSAVFHGKGIDLDAAKASGLMEAIETWHAEHTQLPLKFASQVDLMGNHRLIDLEGLPRIAAGRFNPHLPMLWVEGRDLVEGGSRWLPFEIVHANSTMPGPPGSGCFAASTNGLASGNHLLEATSHALCEVIERDATSLWHGLGAAAQDDCRLDLATVDDALCRSVLDRLERAGIDVGVWETTTDIGVPTFQCLLADRLQATGHVGDGAGCHPKREIALLRALTEAAQVRTTYIAGSREDINQADYGIAALEAQDKRARALLKPVSQMRPFAKAHRFAFDSFEAEVAWLLDRLKQAGIEQAVAVDLTRSEFGIAVVRVVVPGLEGSDHHEGYVPGARAKAWAARAS
jgi:YcaO-like protein with predicted kinase domain